MVEQPKYKRMAAVRVSKADELQYVSTLQEVLKRAQIDTLQQTRDLMVRTGGNPSPTELKLLIEELKSAHIPTDPQALQLASDFVESINQRNIARTAQSALAANLIPEGLSLSAIIREENLLPVLQASVFENTRLIKSLPTNMLDDVEYLLMQYITNPESFAEKSIVTQLQEKFDISKRRAKLIGIDQSHKINGALSKARQTQLGVIGYEWSTSNDTRVRPKHKDLNGRFFLWDQMEKPPLAPNGKPFEQPPAEGSPGMPVMCRCVPLPVVDIDRIMKVATAGS